MSWFVMDMDGKRVASRKVPCDLQEVVKFVAPFKPRLEKLAVESTYNWYWLVDGLQAHKYPVVLANPAGVEQYGGTKHAAPITTLLLCKSIPATTFFIGRLSVECCCSLDY